MRDPTKGHAALRRGRVSIAHANYFLSVCTDNRRAGLTTPALARAIAAEMQAIEADAARRLHCATVMPDHLHLLVTLGDQLTLGQTIGRLKAKTRVTLPSASATLRWEHDFFDHHLRPEDDRLGVFLYIFLNPYRKQLYPRDEPWPWDFCCDEDWTWFKHHLDADRPLPEWLAR